MVSPNHHETRVRHVGEAEDLVIAQVAKLLLDLGTFAPMIYLTELADKLGIDPVEAARAKLKINEQKYPAELVRGKAFKYTEYA